MLYTLAVLLFFIAVASAQLVGDTSQVQNYMDYPSIPGMDFVGFGYDVRYLDDPNQGVRLPLIDYQFSRTKQYKYPLYRHRTYKVPDELFVRTVGTAVASNYEFSNIDSYQEHWAAALGFEFTRESTVAQAPDNPNTTNTASSQGQGQQGPSVGNQDFGNTTSNQQAGFGPKLPAQYASQSSGAFKLGIDFQFRKDQVKNGEQVTVQNKQQHQLYQLIVNNQNLRVSMLKDINELSGKVYDNERSLFKSFFEKYGTHYVQSAMLGGAIELNSVTSNLKQTDYLHIEANATLVMQTNSSSTNSSSLNETLVRDSTNCVGAQAGYAYNTLTKECVMPPEATCWNPMDAATYLEKFAYDRVKFTTYASPQEVLSLAVLDNTHTPAEIEQAYRDQPWRFGPQAGVARDCVTNRQGASVCTFYNSSRPTIETKIADASDQYLRYDGKTQTTAGQRRGIWRHWTPANPNYIEWEQYVAADQATLGAGATAVEGTNFELYFDGDPVISSDDKVLLNIKVVGMGATPAQNAGNYKIMLWNQPSEVETSSDITRSTDQWTKTVQAGAWVSYRVALNWEKYTARVWVKPDIATDYALITYDNGRFRDFPLRYRSSKVDATVIYNLQASSSISFFDNIRWCNDAGGAKYAPMTRGSKLAKSNSNLRQNIQGNIDFGFTNTHQNQKIQESSNYKLKGGDSSAVDLINLRNKLETFTNWKASIPQNPSPVAFTLRSIAFLFSRDPMSVASPSDANVQIEVVPREEMAKAIDDFLVTKEVGEILYTKASDTPTSFEKSGREPTLSLADF